MALLRHMAVGALLAATWISSGGGAAADPLPFVPAGTQLQQLLEPSPTGDLFLDNPPTVTGEPGTILARRRMPLQFPLSVTNAGIRLEQFWLASTDAYGQPTPILTTVLVPPSWNGKLVANNYAIDGIGNKCGVAYQLAHDASIEFPDVTRQLLDKRYAVVMTDYQGIHQAYSHGPTQGPAVLDGIRAAIAHLRSDYGAGHVPVAMVGYSGGAIASVWAAQVASSYAPELDLVGAAFGGTPVDLEVLNSMDGGIGSGLHAIAALAQSRIYPETQALLSPLGIVAALMFKDACVTHAAPTGLLMTNLALFTNEYPYSHPDVARIFSQTRAGATVPSMPMFMWHAPGDEFIPYGAAKQYASDMCNRGGQVAFHDFGLGHFIGAFDPTVLPWLDDRFAGKPDEGACTF